MAKIVRVEVGRYDYDFVGEFKFFKPGPDGKVRRPSVLVRLTDESGLQGWGQAVPVPSWTYETVETVESTLRYYLAEAVLGADPTDFDDIHRRMNTAIRPGFTTGQPLCKAAVDLACHDLAGKLAEKSVSEMLGGSKRETLTLSWTVNSPSLAVVEQQLEDGRRRGYENFNIKVGAPQTPDYDLELVKKVRQFAPEGFLWADANTGYTPEIALEILPRLADAGAEVIESPLPPNQFRGYQALRRQGALPVLMDEGIISPVETAEFIHLGMIDGIAMKPARCGGLWPSRQIIELILENGLMLLGSGLSDPDISLSGALHLYAWANIEAPCALNGPQFLEGSLVSPDLLFPAGAIQIPQDPGLGLTMGKNAEAALSWAAEAD